MMQISKIILFALLTRTTATPTSTVISFKGQSNKMRRRLSSIRESVVNCVKFENNTCECPGGCMSYNKDPINPMCVLNKCWGWDTDKTECVETGPSFIPAIALQAIPFTGIFGSGFGNMGRWDLFGISVAICFGPLLILSILACCLIFLSSQNNKNDNTEVPLIHEGQVGERGGDVIKCFGHCAGCLWVIAIMGWYINGIIVIANKHVKAPNGCPLH